MNNKLVILAIIIAVVAADCAVYSSTNSKCGDANEVCKDYLHVESTDRCANCAKPDSNDSCGGDDYKTCANYNKDKDSCIDCTILKNNLCGGDNIVCMEFKKNTAGTKCVSCFQLIGGICGGDQKVCASYGAIKQGDECLSCSLYSKNEQACGGSNVECPGFTYDAKQNKCFSAADTNSNTPIDNSSNGDKTNETAKKEEQAKSSSKIIGFVAISLLAFAF